MEDKSKILERIQKLLALATSPNEAEAALAAAKAQEIMLKYRVSQRDVEGATEKMALGIVRLEMPMGVNEWRPFHWCMSLMAAVCETFTCRYVYSAIRRTFTVIGSPVNVEVAREVYLWLFRQVHRLSLEHMRERGTKSMQVKNNFLRGCAERVAFRMRTEYHQQLDINPEANALIIQDFEQIEVFIKSTYANLKTGHPGKGVSDWRSFAAGQSAGDRVRLKKE